MIRAPRSRPGASTPGSAPSSKQIAAYLSAAALFVYLVVPLSAHAQSSAVGELLRERLVSLDSGGGVTVMKDIVLPDAGTLQGFYAGRGYAPAWTGDDGLTPIAKELSAVLGSATRHGLSPQRYRSGLIKDAMELPLGSYTAARRAEFELLFSGAWLAYAGDLLYGQARHVELKDSSFNVQEDIDIAAAAGAALAEQDPRRLIRDVSPQSRDYSRLRTALSRLRSLAAVEKRFRLPEVTLHPGDEHAGVATLRRRLAFLGDLEPGHDGGIVFGETLVEAVTRFQSRHGLETDGVVGKNTRAALEVPLSERVEQIELNLERWRWLPRDPGRAYIVVNIAGQELEVVENGRSSLRMKVIVGLPFLRTPSFASRIETIVLNPYWEVPYSIAVKEILPKLREDALYLAREHMQVLKRGTNELVNPIPIDWSEVPSRDFPYRFRQKPGPDNALGQIKFLMPNRYSVYLHDTPAKTLFSRARRCFSHGCVRLEKPLELAALLLHDEPGWAVERLERTLETEQNHRIRLTRPMPVYLVYWTAWVDNKGIVNFRDDVYGRDERLKSALETF